MHELLPALAVAALAMTSMGALAEAPRPIPEPLPGHPGNVFLAGERVIVGLPDSRSAWRAVDYDDRTIANIPPGTASADLGQLPVGWYRLRREGSEEWISLAVLQRLAAPTPWTSPIGVDVAMAWFYPEEMMASVASLAALAGVNHVRDRLAWGQMEPERGKFADRNKYDASAAAQAGAHLRVLQVNHSTPAWAGQDGRRFPPDLRDAYRFYREMARRWRGQVGAFEPWNEADIQVFGGHTGAEMAAMQKASYLGLKAGNPGVTACLNVFAGHARAQLDDLRDNEAWPYFDTYNLHHYVAFEGYPQVYADHRSISAGRPLWVTECAMPVRWSGDPKLQELSDEDLREQSRRIAKVFAGSLHEGAAATFYFILGHYVEGQTQFGIIRRDLTPRPAYVALAAVGRFLADAQALGRLRTDDNAYAYAFRARPDGKERVVVVAWAKSGTATLEVPVAPLAVADHLGRSLNVASRLSLTTAPVFVVLPSEAGQLLHLDAPPPRPRRAVGKPSSIVFQPLFTEQQTLLWASAYRVSGSQPTEGKLAVYNFGAQPAEGRIQVRPPRGWKVEMQDRVRLEPMERLELTFRLIPLGAGGRTVESIQFRGDFGTAGRPVASVRVAPDSSALAVKRGTPLAGAEDPASWELLVSGGRQPTAVRENGGIVFEATPTGDPWFYPRVRVSGAKAIPRRAAGLACTITLLEGNGIFRAIFDERNGSSYVADFVSQPRTGEGVPTVALLSGAVHGQGWSQPDPNGKLDIQEVVTVKVGCNSSGGRVRFRISDLRWVSY